MARWKMVRILGSVLIVLGFGSAVMRTKLDMDTVLTQWMGGAQPYSGIAMGVVGIAIFALAMYLRKQTEEAAPTTE